MEEIRSEGDPRLRLGQGGDEGHRNPTSREWSRSGGPIWARLRGSRGSGREESTERPEENQGRSGRERGWRPETRRSESRFTKRM